MQESELKNALQAENIGGHDPFDILAAISAIYNQEREADARDYLIQALAQANCFTGYTTLLRDLTRTVGLFPYIEDPQNLSVGDQIAYEYHRPCATKEERSSFVFHRAQADVYRRLSAGENLILSAPTSFGKSAVIDTLLETRRYSNTLIIVPTIALIDETRRRLSYLRYDFKIITHNSQSEEDKNIFILTQERALERRKFPQLDLLILDEFYKLNPSRDPENNRGIALNQAFYKFSKHSKQVYLLGPNIRGVTESFIRRYNATFLPSTFNTVSSRVHKLKAGKSRPNSLRRLLSTLNEPTLIFVKSPAQANQIGKKILDEGKASISSDVKELAEWIEENYHHDWTVSRCLRMNIGVHHGRVPRAVAQKMVGLFNRRRLQFLICTSTLIEGVNTSAKNVIIYENKIAQSKIDFFTFNNIKGRSGRMRQYFVGHVYIFDDTPSPELDFVNVPFIDQSDDTPLELLVQLSSEDMSNQTRERLKPVFQQTDLSQDIIKDNPSFDPISQINLARHIRANLPNIASDLQWTATPTWEQLCSMCELMFSFFRSKGSHEVRSGRQLAYRVNRFRQVPVIRSYIEELLGADKNTDTADKAVELALAFYRNWLTFNFPRMLIAIDKIQRDVLQREGLLPGDYTQFASQAENGFVSAELSALEEYGIPLQISKKISRDLVLGEGLDSTLRSLSYINLNKYRLSDFERRVITEVARNST